ncbi:MAG: methyltransferase domain-containing protein [Planctomycetes bacterium]|nr:methyltransferase domain-containing protein [Planctomycetota bacterium]MCB9910333.1 methyltransferase domain-containing protein [Planctomycetota bacterium]MCB9912056.1 methyltransferase domain-containing protein [Planctomycetota bacterium]HPF15104.1 methyltransferase domain-containing protein [Planctomycetota bacterium]HRV82421.1 methyltransferase domain-containing protein [Planctomycetota bacterium]
MLPTILLFCAGVVGGCRTFEASVPQQTQRSPVPENINAPFLDAEVNPDDWSERWEVESREICACREAVVAALDLTPGQAVVDVGAGTGLFVAPFSAAVGPQGKVYAADISPAFVEHLQQRVEQAGFRNVQPYLSKERSVSLPRASVQTAYVGDTYHHFEYHLDMLASLFEAIAPGGQLVVVDFERIPGTSSEWILGHVRAGKQEVRAEIEGAGFRFVEEVTIPGFQENYLLRFLRP